ncbi:hypothetical protein PSENEW3n2_00000888 [Picochlorum sp. SENEW3]|nr:hypothetical protein PSENEW3n2_00000888 [Picochlorum sp. SENEW3]WPT14944.1 hypothetical protein PSENEW3_00000888 [Picochlorum sp. SENEW3]
MTEHLEETGIERPNSWSETQDRQLRDLCIVGGNEGFPAVAGRPSFGGLKMADFGGSKSGPARSIWEARSEASISQ